MCIYIFCPWILEISHLQATHSYQWQALVSPFATSAADRPQSFQRVAPLYPRYTWSAVNIHEICAVSENGGIIPSYGHKNHKIVAKRIINQWMEWGFPLILFRQTQTMLLGLQPKPTNGRKNVNSLRLFPDRWTFCPIAKVCWPLLG